MQNDSDRSFPLSSRVTAFSTARAIASPSFRLPLMALGFPPHPWLVRQRSLTSNATKPPSFSRPTVSE
ncbi:hypothetical protein CKO51_04900 [Rhodopirellula sp. SM50]|nr:hypothetical protein CKO51_04900 [Rhodopirellula sp. SM50]